MCALSWTDEFKQRIDTVMLEADWTVCKEDMKTNRSVDCRALQRFLSRRFWFRVEERDCGGPDRQQKRLCVCVCIIEDSNYILLQKQHDQQSHPGSTPSLASSLERLLPLRLDVDLPPVTGPLAGPCSWRPRSMLPLEKESFIDPSGVLCDSEDHNPTRLHLRLHGLY